MAGAITPVPGGVGPMTIACLLANTLTATARVNGPGLSWTSRSRSIRWLSACRAVTSLNGGTPMLGTRSHVAATVAVRRCSRIDASVAVVNAAASERGSTSSRPWA